MFSDYRESELTKFLHISIGQLVNLGKKEVLNCFEYKGDKAFGLTKLPHNKVLGPVNKAEMPKL